MKSLSSSAAKKDLSVELAKLNISAEKYDYTKITDGLTKALSEIDEQFALGKEIEESETIGNAFMQMFNIPEEDIIRTSKDAIKRIQDEVTKAIVEFNKKGGTQLPTDFNVLTDKTSSISNLLGDDKSSNDLVKKIDDAKSKATSIAKSDVKETDKAYKDLLKKYSEFEYKRTEIAEQAAKDRLDFAKKFGNEEEIKLIDEKLKAISDLENQLASTGDSAERDTLATQLEAAKAEVTKLLVEMAKLKGIPISIPLTIDKKESADLAKLVYDDFINSDLWIESFENVSNLSTGAIQQMITQLEKLGIENRKAFKPKELKEYYDKLESLKKSLIEKNPFIGFAKNMKDALKDVVGKSDLDVYKKNNGLVGSDSKVREMAVDEAARLEKAITTERNKGNGANVDTINALEKQLEKQKEIIGYVDEERFIYLTGRKKNLIITKNGENVSPEELENKLSSSRLVQEVLVREAKGVIEAEIYPDEEYAKKQGLEREEEVRVELQKLIDEYNQGAPAYKKIYSLIIREKEFEKTASRKIKRY